MQNNDNIDVKQQIIDKAYQLGFDAVNFADAEELTNEGQFLSEWISRGMNGDMNWMERDMDIRINPILLLPETKTVIVLAKSYLNKFNHNEQTGKISRYAWGRSYQDVIKPKLKELGNFITELREENKFAVSVDSGRVFEKAWAKKSGIGWQGKNSIIINAKLGSFFFLGIIYTTIQLQSDESISDACGNCRKCITNCPTQAINLDRSIDSRLCISYWLNEASRNGEIPESIKLLNKEWIYGCDVCQDVCPFNKTAERLAESDFMPSTYSTNLDPKEVLKMTEEEFNEKFKGTPIFRLKLKGLKNNC